MPGKLLLWSCIIFIQLVTVRCFAQTGNCDAATIGTATDLYAIGKFDDCIATLTQCLNTKGGFKTDQQVRANEILALCYLAMDNNNSADSVITAILSLRPEFEPNINDPDRFFKAFDKIKASLESNTVSSVSKRPEDIRLAPATTIVITQEQIKQRGYNDLIEVLKDLPGFDISVYYGQLYANVYMRGFRTNNTDKILLLIDGVEDNDLWSNFADISQQYPVTNIKQVEVIYGPASTIYGPNAFSGVINIITKNPADYLHNGHAIGVKMNAGYGSYNTKFIEGSAAYKNNIYSVSVTARLYYSDRPNLSQSDTLWNYDPEALNIYSDSLYINTLRKSKPRASYVRDLGLDPTKNDTTDNGYVVYDHDTNTLRLTPEGAKAARNLDAQLYKNSAYTAFNNPATDFYLNAKMIIGGFTIGLLSWNKTEGIGTTFTDYNTSVNESRWKPLHNALYLNYNRRIGDKLNFTALANYRLHKINNGSRITNQYGYFNKKLDLAALEKGTPGFSNTTYYYEQSSQFRSEVRVVYTESKYFNIVSGVEVRNSLLQGYYLTDSLPVPQETGYLANYLNDSLKGGNFYNVNDFGIYSQAAVRTRGGLGLTLGARLDHNSIRKSEGLGYTLSPRGVVDYSIGRNWVLKAIYSTGIQNASNYTKFDNVRVQGNDSINLQPEKIANLEASAAFTLPHNLQADVDIYYSKIQNVIGTVLYSSLLHNENIGDFEIHGVLANASYTN